MGVLKTIFKINILFLVGAIVGGILSALAVSMVSLPPVLSGTGQVAMMIWTVIGTVVVYGGYSVVS